MTGVRYRIATAADVPALVRLRREGEAGGASEDRMLRYLAGEHHPQQALPPRILWMAEDVGTPVGYVAGHLTRRLGCAGELQWIYVVAGHRGTPVAIELVRRLARWFLDHQARRICVDVGDERARAFYVRHGAVAIDRHWMVWEDIASVLPPAPPGQARP